MDQDVWQRLMGLESRDIVGEWFARIHGRDLSARRSREIFSAARQAREFFANAASASILVRPLLTFYGVSSLSRAIILLLNRDRAEEALARGHGLETLDWPGTIGGSELSTALGKLLEIKIRSCQGTFSELVTATKNRMPVHLRSEAVDWRIPYALPPVGQEFSLLEFLSRTPDLRKEWETIQEDTQCAYVDLAGSDTQFTLTLSGRGNVSVAKYYTSLNYSLVSKDTSVRLVYPLPNMPHAHLPQLMHEYLNRSFLTIPNLHITTPFTNGFRYSQIAVTFAVSYTLGMLCRYYPTHWVSLIQGEKGDRLWPSLNQAQRVVEQSFPQQIFEFIDDVLRHPLPAA